MRVTLQSVSRLYGTVKAVDAVSLTVEEGECFFLLGPSGCGKTTVLRMIAGLIEATSGDILFDGQRVNECPPHERNTGLVFQNYALWPHMTVAENVAFGLTVPGRTVERAERQRRVGAMLEMLRMMPYQNRKPGELSGGQQQRVALARALVIRPSCLLLDEPLSNLDARLRADMRLEIRRVIKEMGLTAIYVTHDQVEALSMADRCALLRDGRLEQVGTPRDLYERPVSPFVAEFMGLSNVWPGIVTAVNTEGVVEVESVHVRWQGCLRGGVAVTLGDRVTVVIRPECIHSATGAGGVNGFQARVTDVAYMGTVSEFWLTLEQGGRLKGVGLGGDEASLKAGDQHCFSVDVRDVLVLAAGRA